MGLFRRSPAAEVVLAPPTERHVRRVMHEKGLTAASTLIELDNPERARKEAAAQRKRPFPWQRDAARFYDDVSELRSACRWMADAQSRMRLYAAVRAEDPDQPPVAVNEAVDQRRDVGGGKKAPLCTEEEAALANASLARVTGAPGGLQEIQRRTGLNQFLQGEAWLVGTEDDEFIDDDNPRGEHWRAMSVQELRVTSKDEWAVQPHDGAYDDELEILDPASTHLIRAYRQHPIWASWPDAGMRGGNLTCELLLTATQSLMATLTSRLSAGILPIPDDLEVDIDEDDEEEQRADAASVVLKRLIEHFSTPRTDPRSAAAYAPYLLSLPKDLIGVIKPIEIARLIDPHLAEWMDLLTKKLAIAVDMPPELLMGRGDINHWNAWIIDEDGVRMHVEPYTFLYADPITNKVLVPTMAGMDVPNPKRFLVWWDPSDVMAHPNQEQNVLQAFDRGLAGPHAARQALRVSDEDAPTTDERKEMLDWITQSKGGGAAGGDTQTPVSQQREPQIPGATSDLGAELEFSEDDHPRDGSGKFTSGDGDSADHAGTREDPIPVGDDLDLAARLIAEGKVVELDQPDEVATLLDHLNTLVLDATARGEKAPNYNLCNVTVEDTNLFCNESKGIPRVEMPQLAGTPKPGSIAEGWARDANGQVNGSEQFMAFAREHGVKITETSTEASHLRATQSELVGKTVASMVDAGRKGNYNPAAEAIFTTREGYVIDGHHRWAATVGLEYAQDKSITMPTHQLDMDIGGALDLATEFANHVGIEQKSGKASSLLQASSRPRQRSIGATFAELERNLLRDLVVYADGEVRRSVEKAANLVKRAAAKGKSNAEVAMLKPPAELAVVLGRDEVQRLGLSDDQLFAGGFATLALYYARRTKQARAQALAALKAAGAAPTDHWVEEWDRKAEEHHDEAWALLAAALVAVASPLLFGEPHHVETQGELDEGLLVPAGAVRRALEVAGGGPPADSPTVSGLLAGDDFTTFLDGLPEFTRTGFVWLVGYPAHPFEPHQDLADGEYTGWNDERLAANPDEWPYVSVYTPGDHDYCQCSTAPTGEVDPGES